MDKITYIHFNDFFYARMIGSNKKFLIDMRFTKLFVLHKNIHLGRGWGSEEVEERGEGGPDVYFIIYLFPSLNTNVTLSGWGTQRASPCLQAATMTSLQYSGSTSLHLLDEHI